jgi:hypothetical protein
MFGAQMNVKIREFMHDEKNVECLYPGEAAKKVKAYKEMEKSELY